MLTYLLTVPTFVCHHRACYNCTARKIILLGDLDKNEKKTPVIELSSLSGSINHTKIVGKAGLCIKSVLHKSKYIKVFNHCNQVRN